MARISVVARNSVPANQQDTFDELFGSSSVLQYGPGSVLDHVPKLFKRTTALNQYLRNESSLSKKIQEFTMLLAARERDYQHIWNALAVSAREARMRDDMVDGNETEGVDEDKESRRQLHLSLRHGAYQAALEQFDKQSLIELTMLIGN